MNLDSCGAQGSIAAEADTLLAVARGVEGSLEPACGSAILLPTHRVADFADWDTYGAPA
jgi:hypothetical protein